MSKATDWLNSIDRKKDDALCPKWQTPLGEYSGVEVEAKVDATIVDFPSLSIVQNGEEGRLDHIFLEEKDALALALWIIDTFGDAK